MTSAVRLSAVREMRARFARPSFIVSTTTLFVAIIAGGVLFSVFRDDSRPTYDVGVLGAPPALFVPALDVAEQQAEVSVTVTSFDDRSIADAALESGDIDVILSVDQNTLVWSEDETPELATVLDRAWRTAAAAEAASAAGLDEAQVESILDPQPLVSEIVQPDDGTGVGMLVGFVSAVLLFISITTFGGYVLTGVVEEKSTGVVEVLLSHMEPHQLLAGKVFGIGTVALAQFATAVLAGLVSLRISGIDVPPELWVGLPSTIGWFIGGFLLYSTLFALAGSFVSRMEDAQSAAAPITSAFTVGYVLVFTFGNDPDGTVASVLSVLPPFSPLLMPLRMVTGAATVTEVAVAAVLLTLAVWGMIRLAGSVYSRTLLHRGSRLTWRQALRHPPSST